MCLAGGRGGGGRDDQHVWDGQGLKDPCFFWNFFYKYKIIEKSLFYEGEIGFMEKITSWRRIRYIYEVFYTKDISEH
jgi:hypothetical protein